MFSTVMIYILVALNLVQLVLFIAATYYAIKWALKLLSVVEVIENSMDILDERYGSISQILQTPLFFDSPQIRQVLLDVDECRTAILKIANMLGNIEVTEE